MTTATIAPAASAPIRPHLWARIVRAPVAMGALAVLALLVLATVLAPWIAPYSPDAASIGDAFQGPSAEHLLGTDSAGRDVLSRLLWGGRITLGGAALALAVATVLGVTVGMISGYVGGKTDLGADWGNNLLMALPNIMVLLAVRASFGNNVWLSMTVLGVLLAPGFFRLTRNIVVGVREELYVDAARVAGLSDARIMRHVLGAVRAPIIIHAALTGVAAIGTQAGLEFIGLADVSVPAWGTMLNEALVNIYVSPGLMLWPGVALGLVNAALILFGNGLRDSLEDRVTVRVSRRQRKELSAARRSAGPAAAAEDVVLDVQDLEIAYPTASGLTSVVDGVSFSVAPGEVLGLVGESGSGKTQTAWSCLDLLPHEAIVKHGAITFEGKRLDAMGPKERRRLLGRSIGYIPQEPMSNLDPAFTIGYQLTAPLRSQLGLSRTAARESALALLDRVGIPESERTFAAYPHQVSGGMAQRVLIAGAVACEPRLLIADEPTTALDVTVQAEVLDLVRDLQAELGMAVVLVTHDFGVVADICDRVLVMQHGRIVEQADVESLFDDPQHPYTKTLLGSVLEGREPRTRLVSPEAEAVR